MANLRVTQIGAETASDGVGALRVTQVEAEGASQGAVLLLVTQVLAEAISRPPGPVPQPPQEVYRRIRRMRQSPHLSDEQVWLFFTQFQLDLEAGLGLTEGQGVDPQLMLQWSDDGGKTWSEEHWLSAGRMGRYAFRAIWRRLGRARTRTWRVIFSDPTPTRWIDAFVQASKGTS